MLTTFLHFETTISKANKFDFEFEQDWYIPCQVQGYKSEPDF